MWWGTLLFLLDPPIPITARTGFSNAFRNLKSDQVYSLRLTNGIDSVFWLILRIRHLNIHQKRHALWNAVRPHWPQSSVSPLSLRSIIPRTIVNVVNKKLLSRRGTKKSPQREARLETAGRLWCAVELLVAITARTLKCPAKPAYPLWGSSSRVTGSRMCHHNKDEDRGGVVARTLGT